MMEYDERFTDNGSEVIGEMSFTDNLTGETYFEEYWDEIVDLVNGLDDEIQKSKKEHELYKEKVAERLQHHYDKLDDFSSIKAPQTIVLMLALELGVDLVT